MEEFNPLESDVGAGGTGDSQASGGDRGPSEVKTRKPEKQEYLLTDSWQTSLPEVDHQWVSQALFRPSKKGKGEIDYSKVNQLWYDPPQPQLIQRQPPRVAQFYMHQLLLWMPQRLWAVRLTCPSASCSDQELHSAGLYPHVCQVVDLDRFYNLATEYLECSHCKKQFISWSKAILEQLDIGHRVQFPAILTDKQACDVRVVCLLRCRGPGNSPFQLQRQLQEQHSRAWFQKTVYYLSQCDEFVKASHRGLSTSPSFEDPPPMTPVPSYQWLFKVYYNDVLQRIDELKADITSTFGRILKVDSTKKVAKKLAGQTHSTAAWVTNVGNELGQVLMCVLTIAEGHGLDLMAKGLVTRYQTAGVPPPELLYVGRYCCSTESHLFTGWPDLQVRLDIWHFMRRFASGCSTKSHQLYAVFLLQLSACIFSWSAEDVERLERAKRAQLVSQHLDNPTDEDISLKRKSMAQHCRRTTRGVEETTRLIKDLLTAWDGEQGRDTLGVPLFDSSRIWDIWESQRRHIGCIQDPPGVQLYTKTGEVVVGGVTLPVYRCARESASMRSFHLHLNQFIPGTQANDVHFQAYLMEGLVRWNTDRAADALLTDAPEHRVYSSNLRLSVDQLAQRVLGRSITRQYTTPQFYTGELIGVEYLFHQNNQVIGEYSPDDAEGDEDDTEGYEEDDLTIPPFKKAAMAVPPETQATFEKLAVPTPRRGFKRPPMLATLPGTSPPSPPPSPSRLPRPSSTLRRAKPATLSRKPSSPPSTDISTPTATTSLIPRPPALENPELPASDDPLITEATDKPGKPVGPDNFPKYNRMKATTVPPTHPAPPIVIVVIPAAPPPMQGIHPLVLPRPEGQPRPQDQPRSEVMPTPRSTAANRRRAAREEKESGIQKRKYVRKTQITLCPECRQPRDPKSHTQYYGNRYCANTSTETFKEWRARMEAKRREQRGNRE